MVCHSQRKNACNKASVRSKYQGLYTICCFAAESPHLRPGLRCVPLSCTYAVKGMDRGILSAIDRFIDAMRRKESVILYLKRLKTLRVISS